VHFLYFSLFFIIMYLFLLWIFLKDFIYLFGEEGQRESEKDKQTLSGAGFPKDMGLNPRNLGSRPEPKADA